MSSNGSDMANLEIVKELYRSFSTKKYEVFLNICSPELFQAFKAKIPIENNSNLKGGEHQR